MGGEKIQQEFEVNDEHVVWLEEMAAKYNLPDESKALRVLIEYAQSEGNLDLIFENVRCVKC